MRYSLIIAVLALAACQPLPKPFSHGSAPPGTLLKLTDGQGISVLPVTDRAGEPLELLATQMVRALHQQNIPATYGGSGQSSYLLLGHFNTPGAPPALIWILRTQQGDEVGSVVQPLQNAAGESIKLPEPNAFERSAAVLAALIQDDEPDEAAPPPLYIGDVAFRQPPLLVAGKILEEGGSPCPDAVAFVERQSVEGEPRGPWARELGVTFRSSPHGRREHVRERHLSGLVDEWCRRWRSEKLLAAVFVFASTRR